MISKWEMRKAWFRYHRDRWRWNAHKILAATRNECPACGRKLPDHKMQCSRR